MMRKVVRDVANPIRVRRWDRAKRPNAMPMYKAIRSFFLLKAAMPRMKITSERTRFTAVTMSKAKIHRLASDSL